jgi:integrase/recombinase XerD
MGELRDRMTRAMTLRRFSPHTEDAYLRAVSGLARHYRLAPDRVTAEQVESYLAYLRKERGLAWSSLVVTYYGLHFFYRRALGWKEFRFHLAGNREEKRLPEVLNRQELERLFEAAGYPKHRALLMTAYGGGLRVSELVRLKVSDIDSGRMLMRVEQGKGSKDRYTLLSARLLEELRAYWLMERPRPWLFPSPGRPTHLCSASAERAFQKARRLAGIDKRVPIHCLRHTFATDLLEAGVDLATIQALLGHRRISSTMRYLRVRSQHFDATRGALDLLDFSRRPSVD